MNRKPMIYIAGPYTGDVITNVRNAVMCADQLCCLGFIPFVPHLTISWDMIVSHSYEFWMDLDFQYLLHCDALFRLSGQSPGADREVMFAIEHNIPYFYGYEDLQFYFNKLSRIIT